MKKIFDMEPSEREKLGEKCMEYVDSEFNFQNTIDMWLESLTKLV